MDCLLYDELAPWYRMLDPVEDHAEEAGIFRTALAEAIIGQPDGASPTLLELGTGAGHNAFPLRDHFDCMLSDLSEPMLALSRDLNPGCDHMLGDMRTLRVGRSFDAVLVHDAICHMTTEADLGCVMRTAFEHLRPGGAAVFALDHFSESFAEATDVYEREDGDRAMRCLEWMWDPDPSDSTHSTEYAFLLREGDQLRAVHDRHVEGLFAGATWAALLEGAGFRVSLIERPVGGGESDKIFLCSRPVA